jgi:NADPH:quinone reductase-like Zn-dependent oxidoreductase
MKAVVLDENGTASKFKYEDWEDPEPAAREVLVRVSAVSIKSIG